MPPSSANHQLNLRILPAVAFAFIAYFSIGAPLAVLPSYVHLHLGIGTVFAGLLVSLQYVATFSTRARAGRLCDTIGPRATVRQGLLACTGSGLLLLLAALLHRHLGLSLASLALSRLALGTGESLAATGATMWGIGRVGPEHTARVISWNGVATYSALAAGAPLGVLLAARWGLGAIGALTVVLGLASFAVATRMAPTIPPRGEHVPLGRILLRVSPYGLALALGGLGFGVIATFVTLFFAHHQWQGAALAGLVEKLSGLVYYFLSPLLRERLQRPIASVSFFDRGDHLRHGNVAVGYAAPLEVAGLAYPEIGSDNRRPLAAEYLREFLRRPSEKRSLFPLSATGKAVRIRGRVKSASRRLQIPLQVVQNLPGHSGKFRIPRGLVPLQIADREQCVVIEHFLEVRYQPPLVSCIAVKTASHLVVDATCSHAVQGKLSHAEELPVAGRPVAAQQQPYRQGTRKFGRAGKAAVSRVEAFPVGLYRQLQ